MKNKNIVLGISGCIAAYKAYDIISRLRKNNVAVQAVVTKRGLEFVHKLVLQTLSQQKVYTDMFELPAEMNVEHISVAQKTDLILIAPATANIIGKIANGIADDTLSTVVMARKRGTLCIIAPAMNTEMYENPIVQDNIAKLKKFGFIFIEPKISRLACGDIGKGALADVDEIVKIVLKELNEKR